MKKEFYRFPLLLCIAFVMGACAQVQEPEDEKTDTEQTPSDDEKPGNDDETPGGSGDETEFALTVENTTATTAELVVVKGDKVAVSYYVSEEELGNKVAPNVIKLGTKVALTESPQTILISGLDAATTYYYCVVTYSSETQDDENVLSGQFTTTDFSFTDLLTVVETYHDGFRARITVPDHVKADTSRAIRYTVSSLPLYLQHRQDPDFNDFDGLEQNAQVFTRKDITVYYTDENQYVDGEGNPVPEEEYEASVDTQLHDKFAPGEPVVFMAGEFSTRESLYGWKWGFYQPAFDTLRFWHTDPPQTSIFDSPWVQAQASDSYWTGAFQKQIVMTNPPTHLDGDVTMEVVEKTAIDATLRLTPSDNVVQYCVSVLDEGTYNALLPLIDNNEDYLQWYFTSIYAFMSGTATSLYGPTDLKLSDCVYIDKEKSKFRVYVVGMGNEEGTTQFFKRLDDVETSAYSLPLPVIEVRKVDARDVVVDSLGNTASPYYSVSFNIKAPNKDLASAKYASNYSREFEMMINAGYSYNKIAESGNSFTPDEIAMINSDEGYTITFDSVPGETTRLVILGYNAEKRCNTIGLGDIADCSTVQRPRKPTVNTDYYNTLPGEWTATVKIESFSNADGFYEYDDETGEYRKFNHVIKEKVTICNSIEYPSPMPSEVYGYYPDDKPTTVDSLYNRFVELAAQFNEYELKRQNRLLCIGFCNHGNGLRTASPWDLFISKDYVGYDVEGIFYDFGPKWFLEMRPDENYKFGSVAVPYNITTMSPMTNWDRQTYYMFPYSTITNIGFSSGETSMDEGYNPVEISDDNRTITIKPTVLDGENYYLTPMYYVYGSPQASFSVVDEIVLSRGWDEADADSQAPASVRSRRVNLSAQDGTAAASASSTVKSARKPLTALKVKAAPQYKKAEFKVPTKESFERKMKEIAEKYN